MRFRKKNARATKILPAFLLGLFFTTYVFADDWPQWRGLNRDGKSAEIKLLKKWPEKGPKLLWSVEKLGEGFSSISISDKQIFITGVIDKKETITSLDLEGNILWQTTYGDRWKGSYPDARTTPTVDGDFVYVVSGMGKVVS